MDMRSPVTEGMRELLGLNGIFQGKPLTESHVQEAAHRVDVIAQLFNLDRGNLLLLSMALQTQFLYQVQQRDGPFFDMVMALLGSSESIAPTPPARYGTSGPCDPACGV